jgi:hypothetical protein
MLAAGRDRTSGRDRCLWNAFGNYGTCGRAGCHGQGDGPKHGPHLNVSYRGEKGKTTGYDVPTAAEEATTEGVAGLATDATVFGRTGGVQ